MMIAIGLLGMLLASIGAIWLLVRMFQVKGALHGILGLLCGLYLLIWAISNMSAANLKKPLLMWLIGTILAVVGQVAAMPALIEEAQKQQQQMQQQAAPAPVQ
jgi:thiol:disulfide interchange protein